MIGTPFIGFYLLAEIFDSNQMVAVKLGMVMLLVLFGSLFGRACFDDRMYNVLPISIFLATTFWLYMILIFYLLPCEYKISIVCIGPLSI